MKFLKENKTIFILLLIALIPLISIISKDKKTDWDLSLKPEDRKPFGTFVFDSLMRHRFGTEYLNTQKTLYRIQDESYKTKTVIVLADYLNLQKDDLHEIKRGAAQGNHYIIAANDFSETICDSFQLRYDRTIISPFSGDKNKEEKSLVRLMNNDFVLDSLDIEKKMCSGFFYIKEKKQEMLISNNFKPVAVRYRIDSGSVIICSSPYFFTNYFLLHDHYAKITNYLLTGIQSEEVYFASRYLIPEKQNDSIFKHIFEVPALKYIFCLLLVLSAAFMLFSSKRRQRIIPVIEPLKNNTLEFIKLIGRIYFLKKNHSDLCIKKFHYLKDYLSRTHQINFNTTDQEHIYNVIATKTGIDIPEVKKLFARMDFIIQNKTRISEKDLHLLIEEMEKYYLKN